MHCRSLNLKPVPVFIQFCSSASIPLYLNLKRKSLPLPMEKSIMLYLLILQAGAPGIIIRGKVILKNRESWLQISVSIFLIFFYGFLGICRRALYILMMQNGQPDFSNSKTLMYNGFFQ